MTLAQRSGTRAAGYSANHSLELYSCIEDRRVIIVIVDMPMNFSIKMLRFLRLQKGLQARRVKDILISASWITVYTVMKNCIQFITDV